MCVCERERERERDGKHSKHFEVSNGFSLSSSRCFGCFVRRLSSSSPLCLFLFQFFGSKHFASSNLENWNLMEYRNLFIYLYKIMLPVHLAVPNLNLSSFMLFLLIFNLEFGIFFFLAAHNLTCTVFPCY